MHPPRVEPGTHAIVLAAGAGPRFGGGKLCSMFQGKPLVVRAVTAKGVKLVDIPAEWNRIAGSQFCFAAGATNLFDKYYSIGNTGTLSFGNQGDTVGAPRMIYGEVAVRF